MYNGNDLLKIEINEGFNVKRKLAKIIVPLVLTAFMCVTLTACGKNKKETDYIGNISENTLTINEDSSVLEIAVQDFTGADYDYSGLEQYIQDEITEFNTSHTENSVELLQYLEESGLVRIAVKYADIETYNAFNNTEYMIEAYDASYLDSLIKEAEETSEEDMESTEDESTELSEDELAEAGLSDEDIQDMETVPAVTSDENIEEPVVATFTDASGNEVSSDEISGENIYMIIVNSELKIHFEQDKILYYNSHVSLTGEGDAVTDGQGNAVIIFSR